MGDENLMSSARMTVLVGTTKGAFLISGGDDRSGWAIEGPYCDGWPINHMIGDPKTGTLWAGGGGEWHGAGIWRSDDGGKSWKVTRLTKGKIDDWAATRTFRSAMTHAGSPDPQNDRICITSSCPRQLVLSIYLLASVMPPSTASARCICRREP